MPKNNKKRNYIKFEYLIVFLAILASISMIRLDPTPYSTDEMNYKDITKLLSNFKIYDKNFIPAFIKINDTYYPSQPIGYSIFSLPFYLVFNIENEIFSEQPQFYFSSGFYPPENDDRGTFYWLENNGIIYVYSKKNDLIKLGFSGISFATNKRTTISFQNENIFDDIISIYPSWYETYFPAKKGWNKLTVMSGNCLNISEIKDVDDYRCVSLMMLNPKFGFFVAKPYIERSESYAFSGNETFVITVINPNSFPVKAKMDLIFKSNLNSTLLLTTESKTYSFNIYNYPIELFTDFIQLKPNQTKIELKVKDCLNCFIILSKINLYLEKDFYDDDFFYEKGFFLEETLENKRWRWANNETVLYVYSETYGMKEFELTLFSYHQDQNLQIYLNNQLIKEEKITPKPKKVKLSLNLRKGSNILQILTDSCFIPYLLEGSSDNRCLAFGLSKS